MRNWFLFPSVWLLLAVILLGQSNLTADAQVVEDWVMRYDGQRLGNDRADRIAVDAVGNVIVLGDYSPPFVGIVKYSPTGQMLWVREIWSPHGAPNAAGGLDVDTSGNIYVTGKFYYGSPAGLDNIRTYKYSPSGSQLWVQQYNGSGDSWDTPTDLILDGAGNVYVTGYTGSYSSPNFVTLKYTTAGVYQWVRTYNGSGNGADRASAIAIDAFNNVFVTGWSSGYLSGYDYVTIKYSSSGVEQWVQRLSGAGIQHDYARAIAVDANGNCYVTGETTGSDSTTDITTVKYDPNGVRLWVDVYDGSGQGADYATALAVDADGNAYIAGYETGDSTANFDWVIIKYSPTGVRSWVQYYDSGLANDYAYDAAISDAGYLYVAGTCVGNYYTRKYDATGQCIWSRVYNGTGNYIDQAYAIAVSDNEDVMVTGKSFGTSNYYDIVTIKYSQLASPDVLVQLIPIGAPIQIPASGGSFAFDISVENNTNLTQTVELWCEILKPGSRLLTPVFGPVEITIEPYAVATYQREQVVPASAPSGIFSCLAYVGDFNHWVWNSDSFPFEKLSTGDEGWFPEWQNLDAESAADPTDIEAEVAVEKFSFHPNPFNAQATFQFDLSTAAQVKLELYDLAGRKVVTLLENWREAGTHQTTLDGAELPSGIYVFKLQVGNLNALGKVVLLK